jgi:hypothetical protein
MTSKKYGYNSYCSLFGNHKGDPCACGWSTKKDYEEFAQDLAHYHDIYVKETDDKNNYLTLGEFLAWILVHAWD